MIRFPLALLIFLMVLLNGFAQGSKEDYERAAKLRGKAAGLVQQMALEPNWGTEDSLFWYKKSLSKDQFTFMRVDAETGQKGPAFDTEKLLEQFQKQSDGKFTGSKLPFDRIVLSKEEVFFRALEKNWSYHPTKNELKTVDAIPEEKKAPAPEAKRGPRNRSDRSPDKKWTAFIKDHNLFLRPEAGGEPIALTKDGTEADFYEGSFFWSPDASRLVVMRRKKGQERKINLIESSPRDQVQPRLITMVYDKPGDVLSVAKPVLFDVATHKMIPMADELFRTPWSINDLRWEADSQEFTFLYNQRGHQVMRLIGVSADGKARAIINEECKTFFDYAHKLFCHHVPGTHDVIWMSERDGWNHLYCIDKKTAAVKKQITKGEWVVRKVESFKDSQKELLLQVSGMDPKEDPYHIHYVRVGYDGSGFTRLTDGDGSHAIRFSPEGATYIDTYSRVDLPPVHELRRTKDGKKILDLEKANISGLNSIHWQMPERFVAKGRDGKTDIWGVIFRPTNFDPAKKYPIIEQIYAGPHGSHVPKTFRPAFYTQEMAELGFILVQIDGMGTSNRSKGFHDVCWKNLGDSGFPDRILWIKKAAEKYPYMDLNRVGIYGGSAGGQSTVRALEAHGDFYRVGVADCGCHDNRMDKVWWNELWMSYPVGPHYAEQSNVTNAHRLQGKLLLIVGELDRNVDPASTMQVVNALIKADKDFELLVIPGAGHGSAETPYGQRRRKDFLVRHLLGVEPRH